MKFQDQKKPTKKQGRSLRTLELQFKLIHWHFARFSNVIYCTCPGRSYKIETNGQITLIRRNHLK